MHLPDAVHFPGVRAALLMLPAMPHLRDWEVFIISYGVQWAELSRSPASLVIPVASQMRDTAWK